MGNQDSNQNRFDRGPVGSSFDLGNFWGGLGAGGRAFAVIFVFIAAYFAFTNLGTTNWVEIPFAEGESQQQAQFVENLRGENLEFRFSPEGAIQVARKNIGQVLSMIQGVPGPGVSEDPFSWVRQTDSILGTTRQREQRWERSQILKLEEDLARLDGIYSVSVTPSRSTAGVVIGSNRKINGVSVQVQLDEDIRQAGISQQVARAIGLHVSGAYSITLDNIILTDTYGHYYDLVNPKLTTGDVADKKKKVEEYVSRYLASIFSEEMYRVTVDVSLQEPVEDPGLIEPRFPVVRGVYDYQEQVSNLAPVSSQFADTVLTRATAQQIPSYVESDPVMNVVDTVAVTVMLDRDKALVLATENFNGNFGLAGNTSSAGRGYQETPETRLALRGFTREVASGIESHLRVHLGSDTEIEARVFPVRFGLVAASSAAVVGFDVASGSQKNNFPFFVLVFFGVISVFVMLRDGPTDTAREAAIQGFRVAGVSSVAGIQEAISTYVNEENQASYDQSMETIRNLTVTQSVTILRQVLSDTREELPGSDVLALLILDQGGNREQIFQQLGSDELAVLGDVIQEVGVLDPDIIEDAMAALDLFKSSNTVCSSGISLPSFVSTVPSPAEVDQSVLEDIRATDPNLADLIERNREGDRSQEVQSS